MNKFKIIETPDYVLAVFDEEIKEGVEQWYLDKFLNKPMNSGGAQYGEKQNVIILTTDQDLIADGVQAIDDDFLKWFVKNPSCENIEINDWLDDNGNIAWGGDKRYQICNHLKIIIPKQESKQETLDKKSLYIQDYKSRISALQYVIDFYEILTKEDIVKQRDDYSKQLKDLENE
jgi:hypothetical protein